MRLRLKDTELSNIFEKYGLVPQYDKDTGKVYEYIMFTTNNNGYRDVHIAFKKLDLIPPDIHVSPISMGLNNIKMPWWLLDSVDEIGIIILFDMINDGILLKEEKVVK